MCEIFCYDARFILQTSIFVVIIAKGNAQCL